jgi:methylated-DNA-[protein]-cysteine S-methyltransferase
MTSYTLFETAIGWAGLAWGENGLVAAHLPEAGPEAARRSFLRRFPDAVEAPPPAYVREAIDGIAELLAGRPADLTGVPIDMARVPEFNARVYEIARAIPPGEVLTYGEVAERAGDKNLAREVGRALGLNPFPPIVPCHRILAASGKTGGFSAPGGVDTKMRLLNVEKARTSAAPSLFDDLPLAAAPRR